MIYEHCVIFEDLVFQISDPSYELFTSQNNLCYKYTDVELALQRWENTDIQYNPNFSAKMWVILMKSRECRSAREVKGEISPVSTGSGEPNWPRSRSLVGAGCAICHEWAGNGAGCWHEICGARAHHLPCQCIDLGTVRGESTWVLSMEHSD